MTAGVAGTQTTSAASPLLTVDEAAAYLRISKWSLYQLIHQRRLKTIKIGNRRLVRRADLDAFLQDAAEPSR